MLWWVVWSGLSVDPYSAQLFFWCSLFFHSCLNYVGSSILSAACMPPILVVFAKCARWLNNLIEVHPEHARCMLQVDLKENLHSLYLLRCKIYFACCLLGLDVKRVLWTSRISFVTTEYYSHALVVKELISSWLPFGPFCCSAILSI